MERTYLELLDDVLTVFSTAPNEVRKETDLRVTLDDPKGAMVKLIMNYLESRGFVVVTIDGGFKSYLVTIEGAMFERRGGFAGEVKDLKQQRIWWWVKTVATVANSVAILAVAIWAVLRDQG